MVYIKPGQVRPQFTSLFDPNTPAILRCFAVLAGFDTGKMMSDDPNNPRWGAVWEPGEGGLYLGGALDAATVSHLIATLRQEGEVLVGYRDNDPITKLLPSNPDYVGTAFEFFDRPGDGSGLEAIMRQLPKDLEIRPIDHELFKRTLWYEDTIRRHGDAETFLAKSRAICLMREDTILCEASTGALVKGVRELGVITHEAHRRRGYATMTCAHLIHLCEQAGEVTYWNCSAKNVASAAVARKLGYQTEKTFQFVWFESKA
jgi:GNAT superfamily N-acetyltransferase